MTREELGKAVVQAIDRLPKVYGSCAPVAERHEALRDLMHLCRYPVEGIEDSERELLRIWETAEPSVASIRRSTSRPSMISWQPRPPPIT